MISNDIPTMVCATQTDDRYKWAPVASAFHAALATFCSQHARNKVAGTDTSAWSQADKDVSAAGLAVARFISNNPVVMREKRSIATRLFDQSLELDENWLEGLGNLIDSSNGELPARFRPKGNDVYHFPKVMPSWALAREFWQLVAECKPTTGGAARAILEARPVTVEELGDKVLIAAFMGGLKLTVETIQVGPAVDATESEMEKWMFRLMDSTNLTCLAAIMDSRHTDEIVEAARVNPFGVHLRPAELVRVMLTAADRRWHRAIWADAKRLGLVSTRSWSGTTKH